jgi:hypothetical protein
MELAQFDEIDFLRVAQNFIPAENIDVYFYVLSNNGINITKTVTGDFETWIATYNHYSDNVSLIVTGDTPVNNIERYTLVKHIENVVTPDPEITEQLAESETQ